MPKDETNTFFNDDKNQSSEKAKSPDEMSKWIGVAEKGINLVENLIAMRTKKQAQGGGETSAYEKGLAQGINQAPAPQPTAISINYKTEEATKYLFESFNKLDKTKSIGDYLDKELNEAKESGVLNAMVEQFLKTYVEVSQ